MMNAVIWVKDYQDRWTLGAIDLEGDVLVSYWGFDAPNSLTYDVAYRWAR